MKPIPLNLLTLYADLAQNVGSDTLDAATISRRLVGGSRRLYAEVRLGSHREQRYLGTAGDSEAEAAAERLKRGASDARQRRRTVTTLKRAGFFGPDIETGRVLLALQQAGLFANGAVLVGTLAYQTYAPLIGAFLSGPALATQDADLAAARLALPRLGGDGALQDVLLRADQSFAPRFSQGDKLPRRFASSESGLIVEVLTTLGRSTGPVQIPSLGCAALPLRYLEYLIEDPVEVIVLYGSGTRIRVPDPARYAVHKLIVHQIRRERAKKPKDLMQARQLFESYRARDPDHLEDAIEDAMQRGRTWAKLVRDGLHLMELGR